MKTRGGTSSAHGQGQEAGLKGLRAVGFQLLTFWERQKYAGVRGSVGAKG